LGVEDCRLIDLPVVHNPQGNLTFIEGDNHVPFDIARVYYLYDVPYGAVRGGHGHRQLEQVLIAVSGSFDVVVDDGERRTEIRLTRADRGLYMPRMIWRELREFSGGAVCVVLASRPYEESDYFRDYDDFLAAAAAERGESA
jgi:dTDP-4-dehydrorhamnose 3,5-epimerase-like enzyme